MINHKKKKNPNYGNLYGKRVCVVCKNCNKVFRCLKSLNRKFCSPSCSSCFNNKKRKNEDIKVRCSFCKTILDKTYIQYQSHQKRKLKNWFCNRKCSGKYFRGKKRKNTSKSVMKAYLNGNKTPFTIYGNGGYRKDLKQYFRSNWEANCARIFNKQGRVWKYEPKVFVLEVDGKEKTYRPDFYLENEDLWIEVKGYWRSEEAKNKFSVFSKTYNTLLIDRKEYLEFKDKYQDKIMWEGR